MVVRGKEWESIGGWMETLREIKYEVWRRKLGEERYVLRRIRSWCHPYFGMSKYRRAAVRLKIGPSCDRSSSHWLYYHHLISWSHWYNSIVCHNHTLHSTQAAIPHIAALLQAFRRAGFPVFHTREGHRPDLSDLLPRELWRLWRSRNNVSALGVGDQGPLERLLVRGLQQYGWIEW